MFGVRFPVLKTVRHYFVLGCYLGIFAAFLILARAIPDLPEKLRGTTFSYVDWTLGIGGAVLLLAVVVLLCGLIGGLVGWFKLDPEERARARKESLVVRR